MMYFGANLVLWSIPTPNQPWSASATKISLSRISSAPASFARPGKETPIAESGSDGLPSAPGRSRGSEKTKRRSSKSGKRVRLQRLSSALNSTPLGRGRRHLAVILNDRPSSVPAQATAVSSVSHLRKCKMASAGSILAIGMDLSPVLFSMNGSSRDVATSLDRSWTAGRANDIQMWVPHPAIVPCLPREAGKLRSP